MFRPNRTGNNPILNVDDSVLTTTYTATSSGSTALFPHVPSTNIPTTVSARTWRSGFPSLAAGEQIALGLPVSGADVFGSDFLQFVYHFSISFQASNAPLVMPFFGRCDNATLVVDPATNNNQCSNYGLLPAHGTVMKSGTGNDPVSFSGHGTFIEGDQDTPSPTSNPLIFGVNLHSNEGTGFGVVFCSLSLFRYDEDLSTYDPDR